MAQKLKYGSTEVQNVKFSQNGETPVVVNNVVFYSYNENVNKRVYCRPGTITFTCYEYEGIPCGSWSSSSISNDQYDRKARNIQASANTAYVAYFPEISYSHNFTCDSTKFTYSEMVLNPGTDYETIMPEYSTEEDEVTLRPAYEGNVIHINATPRQGTANITAGTGVNYVFVSRSNSATSGYNSGHSFLNGETVYGYAVISNTSQYDPQSSWTYIGTDGSGYKVYRVDSRTISEGNISTFGTVSARRYYLYTGYTQNGPSGYYNHTVSSVVVRTGSTSSSLVVTPNSTHIYSGQTLYVTATPANTYYASGGIHSSTSISGATQSTNWSSSSGTYICQISVTGNVSINVYFNTTGSAGISWVKSGTKGTRSSGSTSYATNSSSTIYISSAATFSYSWSSGGAATAPTLTLTGTANGYSISSYLSSSRSGSGSSYSWTASIGTSSNPLPANFAGDISITWSISGGPYAGCDCASSAAMAIACDCGSSSVQTIICKNNKGEISFCTCPSTSIDTNFCVCPSSSIS